MNTKPIRPKLHGLIDYAFAIALFTMPGMIGSDKDTRRLYKLVAMEVFSFHIRTTFSGLASVLLTKWRHKRAG